MARVRYINTDIEETSPKYYYHDNIMRYAEQYNNTRKYNAKIPKTFNKNYR